MFPSANPGTADPVATKIADSLKHAGFLPIRASATSMSFAPATARPGYVVASLDADGLAQLPPGAISASLSPRMVERIKLTCESIRLAGLPVVVLVVESTPKQEIVSAE
jgi:hypothetical protein